MPSVHIHTLLAARGGTTAIARALANGVGASFSCELEDGPLPSEGRVIASSDVGNSSDVVEPDIVHLHATQDWTASLESVAAKGLSCIVTLHDCRALTGGCPYPLACEEWRDGCVPDCPRGFPESDVVCKSHRTAFDRVRPVIVAPSRWMASMARTALPDHDVRVIPNGVPWPERLPNKAAARQVLGLAPHARVMLFVAHGGLDAEYKRGSLVPAMFSDVKARVPNAVGLVVGGEAQERQGDLLLWPYVDAQTLAVFMSASDVLAYPTQADNHPLVILEAMSQGLPVVAYAAGGVPEQIASAEVGVLVDSFQMADMTRCVTEMLSNPQKAGKIGATAFEYGKKRFTQERMVQDYLRLYERMVS